MNTCKVCYRVVDGSAWTDRDGCDGCDGCKGRTKKSCEVCEGSKDSKGSPCASCYPDRNFRWAALKTFNTGAVPGRFERNEFCGDCHSFLCDCGVSDHNYEEAIFEYLEQVAPGWVRPAAVVEEGPFESETKDWILSQIADAAWRACSRPHPLLIELRHQHVIKGVSFCNTCWQTLASTASGCYCFGAAECSCDPAATEKENTNTDTGPCPTCWPDGALRHAAAMDFLAAS